MVCGCASIPFIIAAVYMGIYWSVYAQSKTYDDALSVFANGEVSPYDSCGTLSYSGATNLFNNIAGLPKNTGIGMPMLNTKWSVAILLNAIVYTVFVGIILTQMLSIFVWPLAFIGVACQICSGCAHLAAVVVVGVFRNHADGESCAQNIMPVTDKGITFKDHGERLQGLFISQAVLLCFFSCCVGVVTQLTIMAATLRKAGAMR